MIRRADCFDIEEWEGLLTDTIDQKKSMKLTAHLDRCSRCRQTLERLAASADVWSDTSSVLVQNLTSELSVCGDIQSRASSQFVLQLLKPSDDSKYIGQLDQYRIVQVIGSGGMGVVMSAFDPSLQRMVAIKLLHPHLASQGIARQRFAREARAAAAVVHPNVIAIHAVVADAPNPYLVMSLIPGESLQERIDRMGSLPVTDCLRIASQIAEGLDAAHSQGLVHRDIKPANILLESGTNRVWLTDFGLARTLDDATMTASGLIAGTPQFMSPEQAEGESVDHRSDLFSLGSVLYMMLTGRPPFRAESSIAVLRKIVDRSPKPIQDIRSSIPLWMQAIICKLHEKDPIDRFQSAKLTADIMNRCANHLEDPNQVSLPSVVLEIQRNYRRRNNKSKSQFTFVRNILQDRKFGFAISTLLLTATIVALFLISNYFSGGLNARPMGQAEGPNASKPSPASQASSETITTRDRSDLTQKSFAGNNSQSNPVQTQTLVPTPPNFYDGPTSPLYSNPIPVNPMRSTNSLLETEPLDPFVGNFFESQMRRIDLINQPFFPGIAETHDDE